MCIGFLKIYTIYISKYFISTIDNTGEASQHQRTGIKYKKEIILYVMNYRKNYIILKIKAVKYFYFLLFNFNIF